MADDELRTALADARRVRVLVEVTSSLDDAARRLHELALAGKNAEPLADAGTRIAEVSDELRGLYWLAASRPVSDEVIADLRGDIRVSDPDDPEGER